MSTITATTSTQTLSFDEIVEQAIQERQLKSDESFEELREHICDYSPTLGYDPITNEPLIEEPLQIRCGHVFNRNTFIKEFKKIPKEQKDPEKQECFVCKKTYSARCAWSNFSTESAMRYIIKTKELFKTYAAKIQF